MSIEEIYPPYNCIVTNRKIAELHIGDDMPDKQINNCIEFMVQCLKRCGLSGDGDITVSLHGDTIVFYNQTYTLRQHVLPIRYN